MGGNAQARGALRCQGSSSPASVHRKLSHCCSARPLRSRGEQLSLPVRKRKPQSCWPPARSWESPPLWLAEVGLGAVWLPSAAWLTKAAHVVHALPAHTPPMVHDGDSERQELEPQKWLLFRPPPLMNSLCRTCVGPAHCSRLSLAARHWKPSEHHWWQRSHRRRWRGNSGQVEGGGILEGQSSDYFEKWWIPPQPWRPENFLENMSILAPLHQQPMA